MSYHVFSSTDARMPGYAKFESESTTKYTLVADLGLATKFTLKQPAVDKLGLVFVNGQPDARLMIVEICD